MQQVYRLVSSSSQRPGFGESGACGWRLSGDCCWVLLADGREEVACFDISAPLCSIGVLTAFAVSTSTVRLVGELRSP